MKWENRDIYVVERANIPKFSKLDDRVTPLRLFKLYFDDVISWYDTKLYNYRVKEDVSFEITNEKIRLFLSVLLLSGCHKLPDRKMYLEAAPDTFVEARFDSMPRNMFERPLLNLHHCDNKQLDK